MLNPSSHAAGMHTTAASVAETAAPSLSFDEGVKLLNDLARQRREDPNVRCVVQDLISQWKSVCTKGGSTVELKLQEHSVGAVSLIPSCLLQAMGGRVTRVHLPYGMDLRSAQRFLDDLPGMVEFRSEGLRTDDHQRTIELRSPELRKVTLNESTWDPALRVVRHPGFRGRVLDSFVEDFDVDVDVDSDSE